MSQNKRMKTDTGCGKEEYWSIIEEIEDCHIAMDELDEAEDAENQNIQKKYNKLMQPHLAERSVAIGKIPNFWFKTFMNNPAVAQLIQGEGLENCLGYLRDFYVEEPEDAEDAYKIFFVFDVNPYFTNEILVKEYYRLCDDYPKQLKITNINWKPGKNLIPPPPEDEFHIESFFEWLTITIQLDHHDEASEAFRDEIWMSPMDYYMTIESEEEDEKEVYEAWSEGDDSCVD